MKKIFGVIFCFLAVLDVYAQSRRYQPVSEMENSWYKNIDKSVWPYDVKENLINYQNTLVGWVGVIEKTNTIITDNNEYNIIQYYVKHHYYDWIEDFGIGNKPIRLSPDGEGYIICDFYIRKEIDIIEFVKDKIGDCMIIYGYPTEIINEDDIIIILTKYLRGIDKQYVDPNWIKYGRNGFNILN